MTLINRHISVLPSHLRWLWLIVLIMAIGTLAVAQDDVIREYDDNPVWSPDGTRIVFESRVDGQHDLFMVYLDDGRIARLTNDAPREWSITWSPDSTTIIYSALIPDERQFDLFSLDPDSGDEPVRLTDNPQNDEHPAWSPDGTVVAFTSRRNDELGLYTMLPDGTEQTRLTPAGGTDAVFNWSPDGARIAVVSRHGEDSAFGVYVVNSDGTDLRLLTPDTIVSTINAPVWSPDGTQVAFVALDPEFLGADGPIVGMIGVVTVESGDVQILTDNRFHIENLAWNGPRNELYYSALSANFMRPELLVIPMDNPITDYGITQAWDIVGMARPSPDGRVIAVSLLLDSEHAASMGLDGDQVQSLWLIRSNACPMVQLTNPAEAGYNDSLALDFEAAYQRCAGP